MIELDPALRKELIEFLSEHQPLGSRDGRDAWLMILGQNHRRLIVRRNDNCELDLGHIIDQVWPIVPTDTGKSHLLSLLDVTLPGTGGAEAWGKQLEGIHARVVALLAPVDQAPGANLNCRRSAARRHQLIAALHVSAADPRGIGYAVLDSGPTPSQPLTVARIPLWNCPARPRAPCRSARRHAAAGARRRPAARRSAHPGRARGGVERLGRIGRRALQKRCGSSGRGSSSANSAQ